MSQDNNITAQDINGNTRLHIAVVQNDAQLVQQLLAYPQLLNMRNAHGFTPLFIAAGKGYPAIVKLLIAAGADINLTNVKDDATPLYFAAQEGHLEVTRLLLEAGANPTISNKNAVTPQDIASRKNHTEVAALINQYARKTVYKRSDDVLSKILKKGPKNG